MNPPTLPPISPRSPGGGPGPKNRQRADDLVRLFYDHERQHGVQHGYDSFGRLVVRCPAAHAFAVTWPAHGPITVADVTGLYHPGFHRLPDGRVDLLPIGDSAT
ncbi:hypothetical protein AB0F17_35395 [Nonomuraea sp. NPDC026600]|uniref:hypothetical protein n=1 Tax=Nonomuraea sp. NPDC026600 TaxID=3155363 RepID=UPI0033E8E1A2